MEKQWTQIRKQPHGSAEWLRQRWATPDGRRMISASVAGAIYDCHPFITPADLAAELLADTPPEPKPTSEAMERGNRLEPVIMDWANDRLGRHFETPNELFCYTEEPARLIATLDGYDGTEVLEIKTTTREFTGELPDYWRFQGIHQAICANVDTVWWAIFDRSQTLQIYKQTVTSDEKQLHIEAVKQWLTNIDLGMTPDGVAWTYQTISNRHPNDDGGVIEVGPAVAELVAQLKHIKSEIKSYETMEDRVKAELCEMIGDASTATYGGEIVATWKGQTRKSFNQKAFAEAHPDLVEKFTKETTLRVLRLKGNK